MGTTLNSAPLEKISIPKLKKVIGRQYGLGALYSVLLSPAITRDS